jgi:hypothetical protein
MIQPIQPAEIDDLVDVLEMAAGRQPSEAARVDGRAAYAPERSVGIYADGQLIGGGGYDLLELTVPGPVVVPAARAMLGGVLPTHRRRGLMTQMGSRQLADMRDAGIAVAIATTSAPAVATRLGYGPATTTMEVTIEIDGVEVDPGDADQWRVLRRDSFTRARSIRCTSVWNRTRRSSRSA